MARLTQEVFLARCRATHGDRYDYSKAVYVRNSTPVIVICKEHGEFPVSPSSHWAGSHCAVCQRRVKVTLAMFLERAKLAHGDRYDYSLVTEIKKVDAHVTLICKKHGEFRITANLHMSGKGCARCAGRNRDKTTAEFIEDAVEVWGDTYTYDKAEYTGSKRKLWVTCKEHGDFLTTPNGILRGYGCPKCGGSELQTTEQFIDGAREVHGGRYDYSKSDYVSNHTPVVITCKEHGDFTQSPANHKSGQGCPSCAANGFDCGQPAYFYVVGLYGDLGEYVGFGITRDLDFRLKTHSRVLGESGMELSLLHSKVYQSGRDALNTETAIKQLLPTVNLGVDGFRRECVDHVHLRDLMELVA